jgi:DNA polymerase bacteriophage-type
MKLTIDFESRSACDLKKHGAHVYSEHPTTDILCMAMKWEGKPPFVVTPRTTTGAALKDLLEIADTIEAHNMSFEYVMWENIAVPRYGWPPLPMEKLRCSAAKAAMHSLPRRLEDACNALGLPVRKDMEGYKLMLRMCKPRRPRKGEPEDNPGDPYGHYWHDDPALHARLQQYCMADVVAEEALSNALRDLPDSELKIWQLDQLINNRGILADLPACRAMTEMVGEHEGRLLERLAVLTNGAVRTAKQVEALRGYLRGLGVDLPDLAASTVKEALKGELDGTAKELLEIRRSLGRSSSAKYRAIIDRASEDGRVRGTLLYHGASTGRWSGAGIQPQNFPSRIKTSAEPESILEAVMAGGLDLHNMLYTDDPMSSAGAITRSVLVASPGKDLIVADLSAIEGRMLAWLAGEDSELEVYRQDKDPYIAAASLILHKPYDQVTKEERQSPGKISVLACGYQGSAGAVRKFGGEGMTDDEIKEQIVNPWRDAHPMTVQYWWDLEKACFNAVKEPGKVFAARGIHYRVKGRFLLCRLPSGRLLYYYAPRIEPVMTAWEELKDQVTYMTVHSVTSKWERTNTYGGKLAENATQAASRDILANGMIEVEAAGYPIVLSVHDEIISEVPAGSGSVEEFEGLMCRVPAWANGLPLKAKGFRARRYKK